jgi:glucokinase
MAIFSVDLGGTNMRAAIVAADGTILMSDQRRTQPTITPDKLLDDLMSLYSGLIRKHGNVSAIKAAGIAVPSPAAENGDGILRKVPNLPTLEGMSLSRPLFEMLGLPVVIENDATAASIGENWIGVSKKANTSIMFTLGTGIGGGLIIDGKPFRGPDGSAGEIGHFCVEPDGVICGCGSRGCVEQYASAQAIIRIAGEAGLKAKTAEDVYLLAKSGDRAALAIFKEMGRYLGIVAAGLINALNPDMIIFGGKVSGAFVLFAPSLRREIRARAFPVPGKRCRIVKAKLGDSAGLIGAARSAMSI